MEQILNVIETAGVELSKFKNSIIKIIKELSDKQIRLDSIKVEQEAKAIDLDKREAEIKKIEDIVALKESAQSLVSQSEKAARELLEAQRIFQENAVKQNKQIADDRAENERVRLRNENETKALIKMGEELEAEKANYKLKIAQGIINQADKA